MQIINSFFIGVNFRFANGYMPLYGIGVVKVTRIEK